MCGVNEKFIYPGLDGIGKYIRTKYSVNIDNELSSDEAHKDMLEKLLKNYIYFKEQNNNDQTKNANA